MSLNVRSMSTIFVYLYSMLSSIWVTRSYLSCLWLHPATSPTDKVCMCVFVVPLCAAITVISHQSEAAEPHIDIPGCLSASLAKIDM